MAFTYDLSTDVGKVRLLIMDNQSGAYLFEDAEITQFVSFENANIKRGAALALETMASNDAYVLKMITLLDLTTNGPAVSRELRARAADLRSQADREDTYTDGGAFDVAGTAKKTMVEARVTRFTILDLRLTKLFR